jgi:hypothetical protein
LLTFLVMTEAFTKNPRTSDVIRLADEWNLLVPREEWSMPLRPGVENASLNTSCIKYKGSPILQRLHTRPGETNAQSEKNMVCTIDLSWKYRRKQPSQHRSILSFVDN